ncbi:hypothetical protein U6A24_10540 [Aquimarina gracilis]|uniref:Bacteriocin-like protein n=1 Tax=Aquimarina gracilis TaxID=874422 RepID=A0ABU5ZVH0_9FLAO|nr:hypothetical protein [Aquimarina gracilis]MEB3345903.1 hypothetical protein [Aquimarina gracilis]
MACEADSVNEEVALEDMEIFGNEQELPDGPLNNGNAGAGG